MAAAARESRSRPTPRSPPTSLARPRPTRGRPVTDEPEHWFEGAGRPPRVGLPAVLVHQGDRAGGRLPGRGAGAGARDAGARRRLRARPPCPRPGSAGHRGPRRRHQRSASSSSPARDAPAGATFAREDARDLAFDAEFDAAVSLCQGAFGLQGGPATTTEGDRRRPCWPASPGPCAPAGGLAVQRLLVLLPGRATSGTRRFDADVGVDHERTVDQGRAGRRRRDRPVDDVLHPPELRLLAAVGRARARARVGGRARALRRATRPTSTTPSTCGRPSPCRDRGRPAWSYAGPARDAGPAASARHASSSGLSPDVRLRGPLPCPTTAPTHRPTLSPNATSTPTRPPPSAPSTRTAIRPPHDRLRRPRHRLRRRHRCVDGQRRGRPDRRGQGRQGRQGRGPARHRLQDRGRDPGS